MQVTVGEMQIESSARDDLHQESEINPARVQADCRRVPEEKLRNRRTKRDRRMHLVLAEGETSAD